MGPSEPRAVYNWTQFVEKQQKGRAIAFQPYWHAS